MEQQLPDGIESENDKSARTAWAAIVVASAVFASVVIFFFSGHDELGAAIASTLTDYAASIATYESASDYLPDQFYEQQKHAEIAKLPPQF